MKLRKAGALLLSLALVLSLTPLGALAEELPVAPTQSKTITGFAQTEGITVAVGESEPTLPQNVMATVSTTAVSVITAEDGGQSEQTTVSSAGENVAVTWTPDRAFSSATAGEAFTYTAALQGDAAAYTLSATLPTLTVTVAEPGAPDEDPAEITAIETVDDIEVAGGTAADALGLPAEIFATVNAVAGTAVAVT